MPPLYVHETGGRCRLCLGGYIHGEGATLQEAGDDLVYRLLNIAMGFRGGSGFRVPRELRPDLEWLELLYELGEIAARGGDIRERVFGGELETA
jgi:hypothetical protein